MEKKKKTFKQKWEDFKWNFESWWGEMIVVRWFFTYLTLSSAAIIGTTAAVVAILRAYGVM